MEKAQTVLDVSFASIIRFFVILASFVLLYYTREILVWFLLALMIAILISPFVDFLELKKVSRVLGTGIIYTLLIGLIVLIIGITAPIIIGEIQQITPQHLSEIEKILGYIGVDKQEIFRYDLENIEGWEILTVARDVLEGLFKGFLALIVIISLSFFICIEKNKIKNFIEFLFPKNKETISYTLSSSERKVHLWFFTRVVNCIFVALLMYIVLLVTGIQSPLALAVLIGLLSFIPYLGAIFISFILLSFVSVTQTIALAVAIFIAFHIINLIADNIVTPLLSKKVLDISPALILIAIVIGEHLYGPLGALLAIPVFAIALEFIKNYVAENRTERIEDKKKRVIIV